MTLPRKSPAVGATGRYQAIDAHLSTAAHYRQQADIGTVASRLGLERNPQLSSWHDWRIGNKGSLSIDVLKGSWFNFETGTGGGSVELVEHVLHCDWREAKDWLRAQGLLDSGWKETGQTRQHNWSVAADTRRQANWRAMTEAPLSQGKADRQRLAMRIWQEARSVPDTAGAAWLKRQGINPAILPEIGHAVRFSPECRIRDTITPAFIALVRNIKTCQPQGIERIGISLNSGAKAPKAALGSRQGGVIILSPDEAVETGLALCEGVKDGLALLQSGIGWPLWVTGGSAGMASFPLLNGIDALCIYADNDQAGRKAAATLWNRYRQTGRYVEVIWPEQEGSDPADILSVREVPA